MEKSVGIGREGLLRACIGGLCGVIALLLLTLLCTFLSTRVPALQGREGLTGRIALLLASFLAVRLAAGTRSEGRWFCACVSGAMLLVFLLFIAVLSEHSSVLIISVLLDLVCIIFGGFLGILLRGRGAGKRRRRR